jgi:type II secretory pathway component GspD/PulD (secretin)
MIPVLGKAFSYETPEKISDELLVLVTPHISSEQRRTGSYIHVPMNGPK